MGERANEGPVWDVHHYDTLSSTNTVAVEAVRHAGAGAGLVVVADFQTAGRGRLGRVWEAPPGTALLASVVLDAVEHPWRLTAALGLAGAEACGHRVAFPPSLKWPNDLIAEERKLGGILAERERDLVVAGIGINIGWAPPGAVSLDVLGASALDRDALLEDLLDSLGARLGALDDVVIEYRQRCSTLGREVEVSLSLRGETFAGRAVDISEDGSLGVELADGSRRWVAAGDVVHAGARGPSGRFS